KVREKYDDVKKKVLGLIEIGRNFFDDFKNDMRSFREQMDVAEDRLGGKQFQLLENVAFYDQYDAMNEQRIDALIFAIGVMEKVRDLATLQAESIVVGDANLGDRQGDEQSKILDFVMLLKSRISAFKGRLWAAWAMVPLNRNMRNTALHQAARIDQTIGVSIPAIKESILFWFSLGELEQASALTQAMDDLLNFALTGLANASKIAIPEIHERLATPALHVATIITTTQSVVAQTEGILKALETGAQKDRELDAAMLSSKQVMDGSTLKLNETRLAILLQEANELKTIEISRSVPPTAELAASNN
ncbi:MAG: toxic anion resistance protein, partial [Candidatus Levybacteria bacterium]|nr:toxic anion resistance protein [Candidatus Levybacteria bacterium]